MQHRRHSPSRRWTALLSGSGTLCFLALAFVASVQGQPRPLVLISEPNSTRAVALESITFTGEPFPVTSLISWTPDPRTRVILFALNLRLQPGEQPGDITADAEDGTHSFYPLRVESVEPVSGQPWMSAVCLRLNDQMGNLGDVLVRIGRQGRTSNRVRIAIGHLGDGPADDPGSGPTPAPPYAIRGRITENGSPLAGIIVTLSGGDAPVVTTTDGAGDYSILAQSAADYVLTASASNEDYVFEPANLWLPQTAGDRRADFRAFFYRALRGRVTDANGRGVFGVNVSVNGTLSGTTSTAGDGTYAFPFSTFGNYVVTLSKVQGYYTFAPQSVSLSGRPGNRTGNFTAQLDTSSTPSYVLEFDGTPKTVDYSMPLLDDYNLFWPDGVEYGHFFWEFWAMPGADASGYLVSDGWGGAHAILFGVSNFGTIPGRYQLAGNVWNGNAYTSFASDDGPAPNEWGHLAVGWDGANITTYFNGVPVGKTPYVGPRITPGGGAGCGRLLIGGSDHLNFRGRIAQVRGFENNNPRAEIGSSVFATFAPQTVFSVDGSLLSYFFHPSIDIADLSRHGQYGRQHPGLVRSTANGVIAECAGCPLPQFVVDPTAPDFAHPNQPGQPPAPVDTPAAVPNGALIFDSFSRRNSTYALGGLGGLGSSEGGLSGSKVWQTNETGASRQPFGILNGKGVLLANAAALAWVNIGSGSTDFDIRTDRRPRNFGTGHNTGISFRVVDSNNYFFAYSSDGADASQPQTLTVGHRVAGLRTVLASGVSIPTDWTTMRVTTTGAGVIRVYADDTLLYSTSSSLFSNSDGMGLYNNGPGLGLTNRWDNFRVFIAQP